MVGESEVEMVEHVDRETLREWLDTGHPVTVVDVRSDADRTQWSIPGSLHINAYDALRSNQPGPLADAALPTDRPVVTVCNAGRMCEVAAGFLSARGLDARSLAGGMKGWSLAWNTAMVPMTDASATVIQVRRTGKGCLSYVVGFAGEALVVDPSVSSEVYIETARANGWTIRAVLETHVHADHVSRARDLVSKTGAALYLPSQDRVTFPFTSVAHGQRISVGDAVVTAIHTPGHTQEST
jgi:rhodanese-related sulfurtransferase